MTSGEAVSGDELPCSPPVILLRGEKWSIFTQILTQSTLVALFI